MVRTSKEAPQLLGLVGMAHAIDEAIVFVRLHPGLDAVQGECGEGGQDARGTGGHLGPVAFDELFLFVRDERLSLLWLWLLVLSVFVGQGVARRPTLVALPGLTLASAGALGRHGRRLKLGTILLEGRVFSWHAFWQRGGPTAVAPRRWPRRSRPKSSKRSRYGQVPAVGGP